MKLVAVTIQLYRNFVDPQRIPVEDDVTCLVGKNESGKTTILKALHRLKPANGSSTKFDLTQEYPRWRLSRDRRSNQKLDLTQPVQAEFALSSTDLAKFSEIFKVTLPEKTICWFAKNYRNEYSTWLTAELADIIVSAAKTASLDEQDLERLKTFDNAASVQAEVKNLLKELADGEPLRLKAVKAFAKHFGKLGFLADGERNLHNKEIYPLIPKFFYFDNYGLLPGECDLTKLARTTEDDRDDSERTVIALLAHAGETPEDFMESDYASRKAELQAASVDLSQHVFEYWQQNQDLSVVFDTDNVVVETDVNRNETAHRILKIELRDGRHGDVETNFSTRSTGFQWFFSFFAAFSEYQESQDSLIVLLDEPGTSLHGEAQRDFLRFIHKELGSSKQTLYTTHSQHMVDPAKYEKIRAVHDRATRENPDQGVQVTLADFSTDRDTILPVEAALGYTISQHLFIGSGQHLAVEGSSDFVYLQRLTEHLVSQNKVGLDSRLSIIPVGGADNMPAFVALLGRRLKVSALIDGARSNSKVVRVRAAAKHNGVPDSSIVVVADADEGLPVNSDIEDLFEISDYLRLYNWAYGASVKATELPQTTEPILKRMGGLVGDFDHALPAHVISNHYDEFFGSVNAQTIKNFEALFARLNATIQE